VIRRGVEAGRLRLVFRGVYAVGHLALRREGWWMAALLACGEGAALSHRTAAMAWGLQTGPTLPIDVTTSTDHGRKHRQIATHRMLLAPPRCPRPRQPPRHNPIPHDRRPRRDARGPRAARHSRARAGPAPFRPGRHPGHARACAAAARHTAAPRSHHRPGTRRGQRPQPPRAPVPRAGAQGEAPEASDQPRDRRAQAGLRVA
jgi:hypothetical protein